MVDIVLIEIDESTSEALATGNVGSVAFVQIDHGERVLGQE
jgi:hypothetical protein